MEESGKIGGVMGGGMNGYSIVRLLSTLAFLKGQELVQSQDILHTVIFPAVIKTMVREELLLLILCFISKVFADLCSELLLREIGPGVSIFWSNRSCLQS